MRELSPSPQKRLLRAVLLLAAYVASDGAGISPWHMCGHTVCVSVCMDGRMVGWLVGCRHVCICMHINCMCVCIYIYIYIYSFKGVFKLQNRSNWCTYSFRHTHTQTQPEKSSYQLQQGQRQSLNHNKQ